MNEKRNVSWNATSRFSPRSSYGFREIFSGPACPALFPQPIQTVSCLRMRKERRDSVWVPPKMPAKGWRANIGARWCCGLGDERALLRRLSLTGAHYLSSSLSPSPYLSTSASIDPPPATAELPPPRKASALGAYTSVDSGFSLHPPAVYVEEEGCRSSSCRAERCFVFFFCAREGCPRDPPEVQLNWN